MSKVSEAVSVGQKEKTSFILGYGIRPNLVPHLALHLREGRDYLLLRVSGSSKKPLGALTAADGIRTADCCMFRSNGPREVCNKATGLLEIHSVWELFG